MIYLNNRKINEAKIGGKSAKLQEKNVEIVANGTSTITPDNGFDGISTATINVNVPQGGGGGDARWQEIGYATEPKYINDGLNYAKEIYDTWDATQINLDNKFKGDKKLVFFPLVDVSSVKSMKNIFTDCSTLTTIPSLNLQNCTNVYNMFGNCKSLLTIPELNSKKIRDMDYMFAGCESLLSIEKLDVSRVQSMNSTFATVKNLRYLNLIGFGTEEEIKFVDFQGPSFSKNTKIGIDGDGVVGCKQALIDTFLTNSFDRAASKYPICKIKLTPETRAVLSAEEFSAIEAKGYSIVTV